MARILSGLLFAALVCGSGCSTSGRKSDPVVYVRPALVQDGDTVASAAVPAVSDRSVGAENGAAWLLKEYPSTDAHVNPLYPNMVFVEKIPLAVKDQSAFPIKFQHKGQPWEGGSTVYAGVEYKNVFSLMQHPGKYTAGEWGTVVLTAAGAYFGYQEYVGSKEKVDPRASGDIKVGPDGIEGNFDGVTGTVEATFATETQEGEEFKTSTRSTFTLNQKP